MTFYYILGSIIYVASCCACYHFGAAAAYKDASKQMKPLLESVKRLDNLTKRQAL